MSDVWIDDDNLTELLSRENQARSLCYDCHAEVDWSELGRAFPCVNEFTINCWDDEMPRRTLDASFFLAFPRLKKLGIGDWLMDFRGLERKQLPFIDDWAGGVLVRGEDLGLMLSRCGESVKTVAIEAGVATIAPEHRIKAYNLRLELGRGVTGLDLQFGPGDKPGALYITQKRAAAPLEVVNFSSASLDYLEMSLDKLGRCRLSLPSQMKQVQLSAKSCRAGAEFLLHRLSQVGVLELCLPCKQSPGQPYPELKRVDRLSLSLPALKQPIPGQWLAGIEAVTWLLELAQIADYPAFAALLGRSDTLGRARLPEVESHAVEALVAARQLTEVEVGPEGAASPLWPRLTQVRTLVIAGADGDALPESVRAMAHLEALELTGCRLSALGDLSAMSSLSALTIDADPKSDEVRGLSWQPLTALPSLGRFSLTPHPQAAAPVALMQLPALNWQIALPKRVKRSEQLQREGATLARSQLVLEEKQSFFKALYRAPKLKDLSVDDVRFHLTFLENQYKPLNALCLEGLERHANQAMARSPLDGSSRLFVCGKSGFKARDLSAKAKELGFSLSETLDDSVTHVLVGKQPQATHRLCPSRHAIIDDGALGTWLRQASPAMLQKSDTQTQAMVESVLAMLRSPDVSAHRVAAEMLGECGVCESLRVPLFYLLKTTTDKGFRDQIRALLKGQGDGLFQQAITDTVLFHGDLDSTEGEGEFYKRLKRRVKHWGIELCLEFAWEYFQHQGDGLLLLLAHKEELPKRREAILGLVEGETLNWRRGCGFYKVVERADDKRRMDCHRSPDIFMVDRGSLGNLKTLLPQWLPQERTISELNLGNCYLGQLPKGFEHYTKVKTLDLSFNHLEELPAKLAKLTELETLDLSYNHLYEFPKVLFKLKNLNRLDLRRASRPTTFGDYQDEYQPLRAPQAFRDALPQCEIVED